MDLNNNIVSDEYSIRDLCVDLSNRLAHYTDLPADARAQVITELQFILTSNAPVYVLNKGAMLEELHAEYEHGRTDGRVAGYEQGYDRGFWDCANNKPYDEDMKGRILNV